MISIIICSINPVSFTRIRLAYEQLLGNEPHEFIPIHDAQGLCEAYNRGLAKSSGDIVIFSHDDIEIWTPDFLPRLKRHMQRFDVLGVAGTSRLSVAHWNFAGPPFTFGQITHPIENRFSISFYGGQGHSAIGGIQALDGLFLAFRREAILQLGWDHLHFPGFHGYDVDCTFRAYKAGFRLGVAVDLPMLHCSLGNYDEAYNRATETFQQIHGPSLATVARTGFQITLVEVNTRNDAQSLMNAYYQLPT